MWNKTVLMNFSGIYPQEDCFKEQGTWLDMTDLKGVNCYCTEEAGEIIRQRIRKFRGEGIHFLDSGNYHYLSKFWLEKIQKPFALLVFDHHTDMQEAAFFGLLSCGSWVREVLDTNENLRDVCIAGPSLSAFAECQAEERGVTAVAEEELSQNGEEKLLDWLDNKTDFFSAPASTRFHGACDGGLCMHSLNVYHALHDGFFTEGESEESYAICALLHDLCKANYYKKGTRNVKNDATGQWEKVPSYSVEDLFPYGHGEKSVFLIERFMKLKVEEAVAIRWHMGGFDDAAKGGCFAISEAYDKYPLAVKLHIADLKATYLMEHRTSAVR